MQVKMNLMHSELVLIKIILTNSQYLLNGCYGPKHCAKYITWVISCNPFLKIDSNILKTSYLHLSPLAIGTNVNLKMFSDLIWMSGCEMEKKDKKNS